MAANPGRFHSLPTGIKPKFLKAIELMWNLRRDGKKLFAMLANLEREVFLFHKEYDTDLETALEFVLRKHEKHYGFRDPVVINEFLSNATFLGHLAARQPIYDMSEISKKSGHQNAERVSSLGA